ncbi:MAG: hypothetical protein ACM65M_24845 [Microcoleus sp.]
MDEVIFGRSIWATIGFVAKLLFCVQMLYFFQWGRDILFFPDVYLMLNDLKELGYQKLDRIERDRPAAVSAIEIFEAARTVNTPIVRAMDYN